MQNRLKRSLTKTRLAWYDGVWRLDNTGMYGWTAGRHEFIVNVSGGQDMPMNLSMWEQ